MQSALLERSKEARAGKRSRRALAWLARIVSAGVAVGLLMLAAYGFVRKSLPYHTPQFAAPRLRLTAAETAVVAGYPRGVPAVPVLTWHDVSHRPGPLVTRPRQFAVDLAVLHRDGFHSVPLSALRQLALGRHVAIPSRPVVLTFDEGLSTDWTTVDPILRRYGFTGVVFMNPLDIALKSPSYFLTKEELSAMAASGRWAVGVQVPYARQVLGARPGVPGVPEPLRAWRARVAGDAAKERSALEQVTGRAVVAFAWPVPLSPDQADALAPAMLDPTLRRFFPLILARPDGGAATFVVAGDGHRALPRVNITGSDTLLTLSARLREGIPSPPPADPARLPWAPDGAARCSASGDRLGITATSFALCVVAANGSSWRNYELRFSVDVAGVRTTDPHGPTAVAELRLSKHGQIEVAIGRSVVTVNQRVGRKWSVLHQVSVPTGPALPGQRPPLLGSKKLDVSFRFQGNLLVVHVGDVHFSLRVSDRITDGVVGLGLLPAGHVHSISYANLRLLAGLPANGSSPADVRHRPLRTRR